MYPYVPPPDFYRCCFMFFTGFRNAVLQPTFWSHQCLNIPEERDISLKYSCWISSLESLHLTFIYLSLFLAFYFHLLINTCLRQFKVILEVLGLRYLLFPFKHIASHGSFSSEWDMVCFANYLVDRMIQGTPSGWDQHCICRLPVDIGNAIPSPPLQSIGIVLQGHSALSNEKVQIFPAKPPFGSAWVVSAQGIGRRKIIERVLFFCCFMAYVSYPVTCFQDALEYGLPTLRGWEEKKREMALDLPDHLSHKADLWGWRPSGLRIRSYLLLASDLQTGTSGRRRMVISSLTFSCHYFSSYNWLPQFMQNL